VATAGEEEGARRQMSLCEFVMPSSPTHKQYQRLYFFFCICILPVFFFFFSRTIEAGLFYFRRDVIHFEIEVFI
jgi:hypothetical protein